MRNIRLRSAAVACIGVGLLWGCSTESTRPSSASRCSPGSELARQLASLPKPIFRDGPTITVADLRSDFEGWFSQLESLHPDLAIRADLQALESTRGKVAAALTGSMSQREAWLLFAQINPALRDGHNGLSIPDLRTKAQDHLDAGGSLFPFGIKVTENGGLIVAKAPADPSSIAVGQQIKSINGHPANAIVAAMLAVTEGDTPLFRRALVQRRFRTLFWTLFGDTGKYVIETEASGGCAQVETLAGISALPATAQAEVPAELVYHRRILDGGIGYLKVDEFGGEYRDAFAAFAKSSFAEFKENKIRALIIDVRDNGGGDDPLWQESLMEYITSKPYVHVGRYVVRINKDNADPGDVIGSIQKVEHKGRFTPSAVNPLRLDVPVYILDGPFSYSATIQFLVAAQDFGIAKIAGRETGGLSCQTGQVKTMSMPKTGLRAFTPVIAFRRPSDKGCDRGVIPDVLIEDDGLDPEQAPTLLAAEIRKSLN